MLGFSAISFWVRFVYVCLYVVENNGGVDGDCGSGGNRRVCWEVCVKCFVVLKFVW